MTSKHPVNLAASVRQRLLSISSETQTDPNLILNQYVRERWLYRLSQSGAADRLVLKGATLFTLWTGRPIRPTKDLDMLGYGNATQEAVAALNQEVCQAPVEPDGLAFDFANARLSEIRAEEEFHGQRIQMTAYLGNARVGLQIDIGFGDTLLSPGAVEEFPTLLDFPPPRIRAYSREAAISEKLQAMVTLGMMNSRMKDYYDVTVLARLFQFDGLALAAAIKATFEGRSMRIPSETPVALTEEFGQDRNKVTQWKAFLRRSRLTDISDDYAQVVGGLRAFLLPPLFAVAKGTRFSQTWPQGGPWQQPEKRNAA